RAQKTWPIPPEAARRSIWNLPASTSPGCIRVVLVSILEAIQRVRRLESRLAPTAPSTPRAHVNDGSGASDTATLRRSPPSDNWNHSTTVRVTARRQSFAPAFGAGRGAPIAYARPVRRLLELGLGLGLAWAAGLVAPKSLPAPAPARAPAPAPAPPPAPV